MLLTSHHRCVGASRRGVATSDAVGARTDPTGTAPLVRRWDAELGRRFARVSRVVRQAVVGEDALGVGDDAKKRAAAMAVGGDQQRAAKVLDLIRAATQSEILGSPGYAGSWQNKYVAQAVTKGVRDAYDLMRRAGRDVTLTLTIDADVGRAAQRRADFVAQRSYDELAGIDADMAASMQEIIQQGLLDGLSPQQIARQLDQELDIGRTRARVLARTETIAAHADASLDSYEEAGVGGVTADVEFATAGDDAVCPQCQELSGETYSIDEARDVIPVHPNCRCAWLPVIAAEEAADWNPFQPRVPKGQSGGGEWSGENLTKDERVEVRFYTGEGHRHINSTLREGLGGMLDRTLPLMDGAIEKSVIGRDVTVFRGVMSDEFADRLDALQVGDTITDKAYLSTSGSYLSASQYAGAGRPVMEIDVPKGSRALYAEGISMNAGIGEEEYILPRGTVLRYRGRVGEDRGSVRYQFDLVRKSAKDWNPFQPRVPKGNTGGGEWTEGGATGGGRLSLTGHQPVGLQATHTDALKQYAASIYYPVNKALREEAPLSTQEQAVVKALDEAFERNQKTTEVMQLYRAAGEEFADVVETLKVGEDVTDKAFVSTTIDENYARTLMGGQSGDRKALIEVVLPKDSRAIDTTPFNPFKGENETLLPRNTTFRYLGKERDVYRFRANPRPIAA
jgi:SPP1 gp7 family putative phage head morphogenesis protein